MGAIGFDRDKRGKNSESRFHVLVKPWKNINC